MKRPLAVVEDDRTPQSRLPREVALGETQVLVTDAGDGTASEQFAAMLVEHGAGRVRQSTEALAIQPTFRIAIRATRGSSDTGAAALEAEADVVLGSPRPAFASLLAAHLLGN